MRLCTLYSIQYRTLLWASNYAMSTDCGKYAPMYSRHGICGTDKDKLEGILLFILYACKVCGVVGASVALQSISRRYRILPMDLQFLSCIEWCMNFL